MIGNWYYLLDSKGNIVSETSVAPDPAVMAAKGLTVLVSATRIDASQAVVGGVIVDRPEPVKTDAELALADLLSRDPKTWIAQDTNMALSLLLQRLLQPVSLPNV